MIDAWPQGTPLTGGLSESAVYRCYDQEAFVIKTYPHLTQLIQELKNLSRIQHTDCSPSVLRVDLHHMAIAMTFLPGETLPQWSDNERIHYQQALRALHQIHEQVPLSPQEQSNYPFSQILNNWNMLQDKPHSQVWEKAFDITMHIQQVLKNTPKRFCHLDAHHKNVVVSSEKAWWVDWLGIHKRGDPLADVAKFLLGIPSSEIPVLLEAYLGHAPKPSDIAHFYLIQDALIFSIALQRYLRTEGTTAATLPSFDGNFMPPTTDPLNSALALLGHFLDRTAQPLFEEHLLIAKAEYGVECSSG